MTRLWEYSEQVIQAVLANESLAQFQDDPNQEFEELGLLPLVGVSLLGHWLFYWLAFSAAAELFHPSRCSYSEAPATASDPPSASVTRLGLHKIDSSFPSANLLSVERTRTLWASQIDALYYVLLSRLGAFSSADEQSTWLQLAWGGLLVMWWTDLHFYVTHRLLHVGWLYKNVHYAHHQSRNPGPWSGLNFHPAEAAIYFSAYCLALFTSLPRPMSVRLITLSS